MMNGFGSFLYKQLKSLNMLKKILQLIVVLLMTTAGVMAQTGTVSIEHATELPGPIAVQVDMTGISDVAAISLRINYDPVLLEFTGISNTQIPGGWMANSDADLGIIFIEYTTNVNNTGYTPAGWLLDLNFNYLGGFSSDLTFTTEACLISLSDLSSVTPTYENGSVTQVTPPVGTVSLDAVDEFIGNTVYMPITIGGAGFTAIDAITLLASFDESQLDYLGLELAIPGMVGAANDGVLTLEWTGGPYDFSTPQTFSALFAYYGGEAEINFLPGCEISSGLVPLATGYTNGTVSPEPTAPTLTVGEVEEALGNSVTVPITATGFGGSDLGAITLHLTYDNALTYTGHIDDIFTGMLVTSNSNNELTIEWSNSNAGNNLDDDDVLLNLNFTYVGGVAPITFDAGSLIQSINLVNIPTTLEDGFVTPEATTPTLSVAEVAGVSGNSVAVPITAFGFGSSNLGAITLHLTYDNALVYTGHANDKFTGMNVTGNSSNELTIEWSNSSAGNNLADDDVLLELNFNYSGGLAPITFEAGSLIQSNMLVNIPTTYVDGFVDLAYTVTFTVDDDLAASITDAVITFDGTAYAAGTYVFNDVFNGTYAYSVDKAGYTGVTGNVTVADGNVLEPIVLMPINVTFTVEDENAVAITDAIVTFDGTTYAAGEYVIRAVTDGTYAYSVTKSGYAPVTGNVTVAGVSVTEPVVLNALRTISGVLKYANTGTVKPLRNSTVYLKTADGLSTIDQATTDDNGSYTFTNVDAGDYKLYAETTIVWGGVNIFDAIYIKVNYATINAAPGTMRFFASDVNVSISVNVFDAIWVKQYAQSTTNPKTKPSQWTAPDWVFSNPSILVVYGSDLSVDIEAICSGDANISYTPPTP